jgi:predicted transcriptional regulator
VSENCENCRPARQLEVLLTEINNLKEDVSKLKTDTAVNGEQTKMVFNILKEIKDSIGKIADKIERIESRPSKLLQNVAGGVLLAIIMLGINLLIKK